MRRPGFLAALLPFAALPLLPSGPREPPAPQRWALIVGISDYIHFGDERGGDLPGAERDARVMRDVLIQRWGFPPENVRVLLNRGATRAAIREGLVEWLPGRVGPEDHVTVFFAGHGSQMWDENGDEDDGLDETIAPADVRAESTVFDISDDEFGEWLSALPTENVVVYLDNCNSGTGTREVTPFSRTRQLGRKIEAIERPPGVPRRAATGGTDETGFDPGTGAVLEIAAAQPYQAAVDAYFPPEGGGEGFHGGAFTTFLVRELWRAPADASYDAVFARVREALKRNGFEQDPYLSRDVGRKDTPLFSVAGGASAASEAALPVTGVGNGTVVLGGGRALGITTGSVFATEDGARVVVTSITPERATARIASGSPREGDRARLIAMRFPRTPLLVNVAELDDGTTGALRAALGGTDAVTLEGRAEAFSHLLLRRRGDSVRVVGLDGATRTAFAGTTGEGGAVAGHLRKEAAARRLAEMENLAQGFDVEVWLEGGARDLGLGETVVFHARSGRAGYLTLVDLGTDGTVTVLFPNAYETGSRVEAGETRSLPSESMGFEIEVQPPTGRGLVRAFVTPEPLAIPVEGSFTTGDELLADRITAAVEEAGGRPPEAPDAVRLDTWGSASLVYTIHP